MVKKAAYQIRNWNLNHEVAQSRSGGFNHSWVACPNSHDGIGFRRMSYQPNSVALFCCWNLLVQLASKMPVRGVLADENGPLDFRAMQYRTGYPLGLFAESVPFFLLPEIRWLEMSDAPGATLGNLTDGSK